MRNVGYAIQLSEGWKGYLITHEVYFTVLEGVLMALVVITLKHFLPGEICEWHTRT